MTNIFNISITNRSNEAVYLGERCIFQDRRLFYIFLSLFINHLKLLQLLPKYIISDVEFKFSYAIYI